MLAVDSGHHHGVPDGQEHVLVVCLSEDPTLKLLKLLSVVHAPTEINLLADLVYRVVEEMRYVKA